jgi:hypothetical protein
MYTDKIVVFDLDETLGHFVELGIFTDSLKHFYSYKNIPYELNQTNFNTILDLYPEFLRPNIIDILNYLKDKKEKRICSKVMIYTNNQGPREWAEYIKNYFHYKLNYPLFDQIIAAFKVNGKRVELGRTSHDKCYDDFVRCTKVPHDAQICFLDDTIHDDMIHENVFYINVKPYINDVTFKEMIHRYAQTDLYKKQTLISFEEFNQFMLSNMAKYRYSVVTKTHEEIMLDEILSKRILQHLKTFFKQVSDIGTRKNRRRRHNKTLKKSLKV